MSVCYQFITVFTWLDLDMFYFLAHFIHNSSPILDYEYWARSWSRFLGSQPPSDLVINPVVGCQYFPPGPRLLPQPKRSSPLTVPYYIAWRQRHRDTLYTSNHSNNNHQHRYHRSPSATSWVTSTTSTSTSWVTSTSTSWVASTSQDLNAIGYIVLFVYFSLAYVSLIYLPSCAFTLLLILYKVLQYQSAHSM